VDLVVDDRLARANESLPMANLFASFVALPHLTHLGVDCVLTTTEQAAALRDLHGLRSVRLRAVSGDAAVALFEGDPLPWTALQLALDSDVLPDRLATALPNLRELRLDKYHQMRLTQTGVVSATTFGRLTRLYVEGPLFARPDASVDFPACPRLSTLSLEGVAWLIPHRTREGDRVSFASSWFTESVLAEWLDRLPCLTSLTLIQMLHLNGLDAVLGGRRQTTLRRFSCHDLFAIDGVHAPVVLAGLHNLRVLEIQVRNEEVKRVLQARFGQLPCSELPLLSSVQIT
jgi:hypothetical protein